MSMAGHNSGDVDYEFEMSRVMQRLFNHPLALHPARVEILLSVVRSKYGLRQITSGGRVIDTAGMDALAMQARQQASIAGARREGKIFQEADEVAIIPVWGTLVKDWGLDPWSGITGYDGIERKAIAAMEDSNIKGVWLDIDSGGGDVAGLADLCDLLVSLSARKGGKPIYAMAAEHAYSAAYAIAACADKVFVPRFGGVGSIGVITIHASFARQLEESGVDVTVIRAGEEKARANALEQLPEATRAHIQAQVDEIREWFIKHVSDNMPAASQKTVRETEGLDYMGETARAIGLVTAVCSELEAWGKLQRRIKRQD